MKKNACSFSEGKEYSRTTCEGLDPDTGPPENNIKAGGTLQILTVDTFCNQFFNWFVLSFVNPVKAHLKGAQNRNLIEHFAKLAKTSGSNVEINLELVDELIKRGADVNSTDKYGQTVLHEVNCFLPINLRCCLHW